MKVGDTVRYLNAVGGGKIVRIEGKIAFVDDDGFETPVMVNELVVVLPAGHTPDRPGRTMFDQKAFDTGKTDNREPLSKEIPSAPAPVEEEEFPIEETEYGDDMTVVLAFEPKEIKQLSETPITAYLVNDSNFFLDYQLLCRDEVENGWKSVSHGTAAPNELVDLGQYTQDTVKQLERIVFQAIVYKKDKPFEFKPPISASRKIDLTKFYKVHCFRPGVYFDTPVLEVLILAETQRKRN